MATMVKMFTPQYDRRNKSVVRNKSLQERQRQQQQHAPTDLNACCICHTILRATNMEYVGYTHYSYIPAISGKKKIAENNDQIVVCYSHLQRWEKESGGCVIPLPSRKPRHFDLVEYLNQLRTKLKTGSVEIQAAENTMNFVLSVLDTTGLSKFVGGYAEFVSFGLEPTTAPLANQGPLIARA